MVGIDRSASDKLRLTLDRVVLDRTPPVAHPGPGAGLAARRPGLRRPDAGDGGDPDRPPCRARGAGRARRLRLSPAGLVRRAWRGRLHPDARCCCWRRAEPGPALWFARLRMRSRRRCSAALPGQPGAFAAVLMTGDRSGLSRDDPERPARVEPVASAVDLGPAHGAALAASVFAALRLGLALVPPLALRLPIRKVAAVGAMLAGGFYYLLSGQAVPAERAFVMVAVMFGAVLVDRRAISLRSVALAAVVVLATRPETHGRAGVPDVVRRHRGAGRRVRRAAPRAAAAALGRRPRWRWRCPRWSPGAATAPFAAAHFNRIADYGLIANLLSVPLMGLAGDAGGAAGGGAVAARASAGSVCG